MSEETTRAAQLRQELGLITDDDLAIILEVEKHTLMMWRGKNYGPDYVKLGRGVFYRLEDVEEWIKLNVVPTQRTAA